MKLSKLIKTSKQKIVNIATNKAIISIAIFFYLVLFLIRAKEKNFGQAIEDGKNTLHILKNFPVPVVAAGAAAASAGAGAVAAGTETAAVSAGVGTEMAAAGAGELSAAGAGELTEAGLEGAKAAKTGIDAAKTGTEAANAAKNASTTEAAAAPKPVATNGSAVSPKNVPKIDEGRKAPSLNDELKTFRERYNKISDASDTIRDNKKKEPDRMEEENNKGAETETTIDEGTTALTGKSKLAKATLFVGLAAAMLIMVAGSYVMLSAQQVSPTSTVVKGVSSGGGGSPVSIGSRIGAFFEKLKNAVTGNGYYTNEENLYAKIKAEYQSYLQQYGVEIDVPTISSTLFYDVDSFGTTDKNNDGLPDIDDHLIERTNNVSNLASLMLQIYETKFNCTQENDNGTTIYKKVFVQTVPIEKNEMKTTNVCSAETAGQSIYEYSYEVDLDHYYEKLTTTDVGINALKSIYGDKAKDEIQRRTLAAEIEGYSTQWTDLYGVPLTEDDCPSPGTITGDVLSQMQAPVREPYKITSYFGYRTGEFAGFHRGIDVVPTEVVNIFAAADGVVTKIESGLTKSVECGNVIEITHDFNGVKYVTQYEHLADNSIIVNVGDTVKKGQQIAVMGNTGQTSGAHLHFQMWKYDPASNGRPTDQNVINTVNLFESASNYIYQCKSSAGDESNCSLEGSIASIAQAKGYNFNIIRAIVQYESSSSSSDLLVLGLKPEDLKAELDKKLDTPEGQAVAAQINFNDNTVNIDGIWQSFAGSTQQIARHRVVDLIGTVNVAVYGDIAMGIGQIKGTNCVAVGYATPKDMYDGLSKSKYAQVQAMVKYLEYEGASVISVLKNIGNMTTDAEIDQAVDTLVKAYRPGGPDAWKANVISNYKKFRDDPNSTIANYIGQCSASSNVTHPDWKVCSTYEDQTKCNGNISKYTNVANQLLNQTTDPTRKKILTNALSLWGYVRYCGTHDDTYHFRCDANYRPIYQYEGQGFRSAWGIVHTYRYSKGNCENGICSAGVTGLDCGGFVTWVYNQTFNTRFTYVLNGPCTGKTQYTTAHRFPNSDLSVLQAGDGICSYHTECNYNPKTGKNDDCSTSRHTLIYMGTINGRYYFIHTGSGTLGVMIFDLSASGVYNENWSYYFTIN